MIVSTQGIAIKSIPYKESSTIVSVYTEAFGIKSYIVKGGRQKNASVRSALFQPLQILNLVVYENPKNNLQTIKEATLGDSLINIHTDIVRTTLAFFITEVVHLSLKEENKDTEIYSFLKQTIINLNNTEKTNLKDFHLHFLYDFATILGFEPFGIKTDSISKQERNELLSLFITFYQTNITNSKPIQSQQILRTIL